MKENNLIADFMGWKLQDNPTERWYGSYREPNGILHKNTDKEPLLFHTSWDWLMPVVEKIECTTIDNNDNSDNFFNVMIEVFECNINGGNICICESGNTKLEATYKAVVEFINQLNK